MTTGLHVAAAVADALRPGDQLVLGASNPVRDAALVGLRPDGIKVRSTAASPASTGPSRRPSVPRSPTTVGPWRS